MKLAFSSNAYKSYSLKEAIDSIKNIGYTGIEILADIPHFYPQTTTEKEIETIKTELKIANLEISNINAFTMYAIGDVYHPSWIENDENLIKKRVDHTINSIKLAKKLGAKNLSIEPGGPIQNNNNNNENREALTRLFLDGINKVSKTAEQEDIKILIEPEPGLLLENSDQFLNFIKQVESKNIRLNFDIGHFFCVNEDPAKTIYKLIDYIEHFHLADIAKSRIHEHLIPGLGAIDFKLIFKTLKEIGYKEFITIELYPYQDNPHEAAKKAFEYISQYL